MKIIRSSKCYFSKWLTDKKKAEIKELLAECARVANYYVEHFEDKITSDTKKFDVLRGECFQEVIRNTETFLTSRLVQVAISEAFSAIQSAKSNAKNREDNKYFRPVFYGKKLIIGPNCCEHSVANSTQTFDYNVILKCLRTDKGRGHKISIPLKRHTQFNKWFNKGKICSSIVLTENYIMFSFEIETGPKKEDGGLIGFDFGMKRLGTMSDGNIVGKDIEKHLYELQRKKSCSKAYYRKKKEISYYINKEMKDINFKDNMLIAVENLKNMKYKMKERGRLSKNIRSVFYNLSYKQVLQRIEMLCEENRVAFRRVSPYYTSLTCSHCGHMEKGNRLSQELFVCQKCGYSANADFNASQMILKRFTTGTCGSRCEKDYLIKAIEQLSTA